MKPPPRQEPESPPQRLYPRWETAVIGGSFLLLWVWYFARQSALSQGRLPPNWWQALLIVPLIALFIIFVRRTRLVVRALRGEDETGGNTPPWMPPRAGRPHPGGNGSRHNASRNGASRNGASRNGRSRR